MRKTIVTATLAGMGLLGVAHPAFASQPTPEQISASVACSPETNTEQATLSYEITPPPQDSFSVRIQESRFLIQDYPSKSSYELSQTFNNQATGSMRLDFGNTQDFIYLTVTHPDGSQDTYNQTVQVPCQWASNTTPTTAQAIAPSRASSSSTVPAAIPTSPQVSAPQNFQKSAVAPAIGPVSNAVPAKTTTTTQATQRPSKASYSFAAPEQGTNPQRGSEGFSAVTLAKLAALVMFFFLLASYIVSRKDRLR